MTKKERYKLIKTYEEEAQANLNLYLAGKDDNAYERYKTLREYVKSLCS